MTDTDQSPYGPTWYAASVVPAPQRRALTHDLDVDLCVIGAGLAGLTVAREVARRGWSVAVLDEGRVGARASGRNGGFVSPGFSERIEAVVDRVGLPRAKELWALSEAGVDYVRGAIRDLAMPGVDPRDGRLSVRRTDDAAASIEHVAMLRVEFGADVEAWPTEQVREVLRSPAYFQAVHFANAFHIHPLNYTLGLAAAAEATGARIFEGTTATGIDAAGVRKRVQTSGGLIRAHQVVLAGNVQVGGADRGVGATVLPVSTYVAVTKPLGETLFDAVRYTGAVADTRRAGDCYRIVADDRLMWGGRFTTREASPRRLKALMRRDMLRTYPQLDGVEIEYAWSGTMGYALHMMPQIGELAPGYWLAGAFGGHGINTTAMAGELIARAILDGDDRWRLFSSYELVWAGGRAGRVAAQAVAWTGQARDALTERIARYRDAARRQAAAQQAQWDAEHAKRRAETEARHAEAEARRIVAEEARKAEEDAQRAELQARRSTEQARRAMQADAARRARERVEATRRARTELEGARQIIKQLAERTAPGEPAAPPAAEAATEPVVSEPVAESLPRASVPEPRPTEPVVEPVPPPILTAEAAPAEAAPIAEAASLNAEAPSQLKKTPRKSRVRKKVVPEPSVPST
jgi:glycine/D-amino acid oxidase-like deaminating enzyme